MRLTGHPTTVCRISYELTYHFEVQLALLNLLECFHAAPQLLIGPEEPFDPARYCTTHHACDRFLGAGAKSETIASMDNDTSTQKLLSLISILLPL